MKRLIVLVGILGLVVAGAAIALASDGGSAPVALQEAEDEVPSTEVERRSPLDEVLDELVEEDVITEEQADTIRERVADARADRGFGHHDGFRHFRFPDGSEPPEGFELPELPDGFEFPKHFEFPEDLEVPGGFGLRGPIEIPEEVRGQLNELLESLDDEFDLPFRGRMFRFPGGTLRDFLDDGELSQEELDQIEAELRELAEELRGRYELRFGDEASIDA